MRKAFPILVGIIISLVYFSALFISLKDTGIFWDEPAYYEESIKNLAWLKNPSFSTIDNYWGPVQLSPPMEKIAQGLSFEIFHTRLQLLGIINSLKLPNLLFAAAIVLAVYFFTLKYFGFFPALSASLFLALTPRFFGQAHFAALDIPLTFFIFLSAWAFWEKKDKNLLLPAILISFALLTKITGIFFIFPFALFYVIYSMFKKKSFVRIFLNLLLLFILPQVLLILLWPKIWLNPLPGLLEAYSFYSVSHNPVPFLYFGETFTKPPWHFPWVMIGITTPLSVLLFATIGIFGNFLSLSHRLPKLPRSSLSFMLFLLLNLFFLPLLFSLPWVPVYDAERLLLPSFPFLAILAALGLSLTIKILVSLFPSSPCPLHPLLLLLLLPFLFSYLLHYYPFETSSYNLLIGGLKGAVRRGMEPQYTLEAYRGTLNFLNHTCPQNCLIYAHSNVSPYLWYQKDYLLRPDIRLSDNYYQIPPDAYYYILPLRKSLFFGPAWLIDQKGKPKFQVILDNTPLVNIYRLDDLKNIF